MATATNTIDILDVTGKKSGTVELPAELFDVQTNVPLIHQVVVAQLAAARQGTHKTKTRGEVSGAGRKPFKQKGTGRARQGSIRAPQMTGGGIVHGPQPRDYSQRTPKKMIAAALLGALSDRARGGRIHAVEALRAARPRRPRDAVALLEGIAPAKHFLVVLDPRRGAQRACGAQHPDRARAAVRPAERLRRARLATTSSSARPRSRRSSPRSRAKKEEVSA